MKRVACVAAFLCALTACATFTSDVKKMSGAFEVCAKADLGALVNGKPAATAVQDALALNGPTLETDLLGMVPTITADGIDCAIAAIDALKPAQVPAAAVIRAKAVTTALRAAK